MRIRVDLYKLRRPLGAFSICVDLKIISSNNCIMNHSDVSVLCQIVEEDPNCHPKMRGNWLTCSGTTEESPVCYELEDAGEPVSVSTAGKIYWEGL